MPVCVCVHAHVHESKRACRRHKVGERDREREGGREGDRKGGSWDGGEKEMSGQDRSRSPSRALQLAKLYVLYTFTFPFSLLTPSLPAATSNDLQQTQNTSGRHFVLMF